MKTLLPLVSACFTISAMLEAAPAGDAPDALRVYPKNLARQHIGANIFRYHEASQSFVPTESAAAWLDDDIATGWPAATGRQYHMLAFPGPELVSNFALSTLGTAGTVSLYAGDEAAPPSAKSWVPLVKDIQVASINDKMLSQSFSRFAKYILIETNLAESGPWYSIYFYGERPATSYALERRTEPMSAQSVFKFVNDQTSISLSSLYTKGQVAFADPAEGSVSWQKAIDDNPATSINLTSSGNTADLVVKFNGVHDIQRVSILADAGVKGRLDFYLVNDPAVAAASTGHGSDYLRANYQPEAQKAETASSVALDNLKPAASIAMDGTNSHVSADFLPVKAAVLLVAWTPETAGQPLAVREVNSFGSAGVTAYAVSTSDNAAEELASYDASKDGKEMLDAKDAIPPIGENLAAKTPFVPGPPPVPPVIPLSPDDPRDNP